MWTDGDDWRLRAACRDIDPELFFPLSPDGPGVTQIQQAKAVCATCPVQPECLAFALATGQSDGVWGGLTENERSQLPQTRPNRSSAA